MRSNKRELIKSSLKGLLLAALLLMQLTVYPNSKSLILKLYKNEKPAFHSSSVLVKKTTEETKKCSFHFINPFKKNIIPSTYVKFVLKNKKGSFLNIKIGYIS